MEIINGFGGGVRLIRGSWRNGNSARNAALDSISGEWVQFLDADDELRPEKIESNLAQGIESIDMVYSPLVVRDESTESEVIHRPTGEADFVEQWLRWDLCQTGAALWRTESLRRIGGWREGLPCCQDNELTLRALKEGLNLKYVDHPGAIYRIWSEETVCRKDPRRVIRQKTELIDDCLAWLGREGRMRERYRKVAGEAFFAMARTLAQHDVAEAAAFFRQRRDMGLISMTGPAAPARFKMFEKVLGFGNAERIAAWLR